MAVIPEFRWPAEERDAVRCPLCGDTASKPVVLEVATRGRLEVLHACTKCSLRFFPELAPGSYAEWDEQATMRGFEIGYGLVPAVKILDLVDTRSVRRFLEIGCGTGFTLDFARSRYGWEVRGLDESAWSRAAGQVLGLDVVDARLGEADAGVRSWDLALACEVIEHVTDPVAFASAAREALTPGGVLLLSTPNAEWVRPGVGTAALIQVVSPGFHTMLHTPASLERTLRDAGFDAVQTHARGPRLFAAAANGSIAANPDPGAREAELLSYLRERPKTLPQGSPARVGLLLQRAVKASAHGDRGEERIALRELEDALRARHGRGFDASPDALPSGAEAVYCYALAMEGSAALAVGDHVRAARALRASVDAGERALAGGGELANPEVDVYSTMLRAAVGVAVYDDDADAVVRQLDAPGFERDELMLELFTRSVALGSHTVAAAIAGDAAEAVAAGGQPSTPSERQARWALAMFDLHRGALAEAAAGFETLLADPLLERALRRSATFHAGWAHWHVGERDAARPFLQAIADGGAGEGDDWPARAGALLSDPGEDAVPTAAEHTPPPPNGLRRLRARLRAAR